jgi:hypothetical protein
MSRLAITLLPISVVSLPTTLNSVMPQGPVVVGIFGVATQSRKTPGIPYRCDVETATVQAEAA